MQYLLTVMEDRTHRKRAEAQIARLVHHDLLTGLPNRAAFTACIDATIETAANEGQSFALMCLDFDRFKEVNDVYGHAVGDEMLRQLSKRLQAAVGGAFLARLGGDEFVVIATDGEQPAAAEAMADRLLAAVNEEIPIDGYSVRAGLSIGIAIFPVDGADADHADRQRRRRALSRQGGRARHVPLLRSRHGQAAARAARAAAATANGDRARRIGPALPAAGAHRRRDHRLRGAGPLAASATRPDLARHLHPARRGKRPDRARWANGSCARPAGRRRPGPIRCRSRSTCRRCSSATAICRRSCIRCCWKPDCRHRAWNSRSPKAC